AVGGDGGHVGRRGAEFADDGDHRLVGAQGAKGLVEFLAAGGGAAGRIDGDDDGGDHRVGGEVAQHLEARRIGGDGTVNGDAGNALADTAGLVGNPQGDGNGGDQERQDE